MSLCVSRVPRRIGRAYESNFDAFKIISRIKSRLRGRGRRRRRRRRWWRWRRQRQRRRPGWGRGWEKRNVFVVLCRKRHVQSAQRKLIARARGKCYFRDVAFLFPRAPECGRRALFIYLARNIVGPAICLQCARGKSLTIYVIQINTSRVRVFARVRDRIFWRVQFFSACSPPCVVLCFNSPRPLFFSLPRPAASSTPDAALVPSPSPRRLALAF